MYISQARYFSRMKTRLDFVKSHTKCQIWQKSGEADAKFDWNVENYCKLAQKCLKILK